MGDEEDGKNALLHNRPVPGYIEATRPIPEQKEAKTANGHWQIDPAHVEDLCNYRQRMVKVLKKQWVPLVGKSRKEEAS